MGKIAAEGTLEESSRYVWQQAESELLRLVQMKIEAMQQEMRDTLRAADAVRARGSKGKGSG